MTLLESPSEETKKLVNGEHDVEEKSSKEKINATVKEETHPPPIHNNEYAQLLASWPKVRQPICSF